MPGRAQSLTPVPPVERDRAQRIGQSRSGIAVSEMVDKPPLRRVFVGLALIQLAIMPPGTPSGDGASMLAVADGLATGPTFEVGCQFGIGGRGGACFSTFYPLLSLLASPLVWIGRALGSAAGVSQEYSGHFLAFVVPALASAGAATLTAGLASRLGANRRGAIATAVVVAFGTEMLTYSRSFFAETLAAFCVVLAVWGLTGGRSQRPWGFIGIALAVLAKPQTALFGPALGVALALRERRLRPLLESCAATLAGALVYFAYNSLRFESITNFGGKARELSLSDFAPIEVVKALGLLTISPGRGLLWFSPVAVLGLVILWQRRRELIPAVCLAGSTGLLLIYLGNPGSGFNWGTRYLVATLPLLCVAIGTLRGRLAVLAATLAVIGFAVQIPNLPGFYQRYHREQADQGIQPREHHWSVTHTQLVGVWPATVRQIRSAAKRNPADLVNDRSAQGGRQRTENQQLLNVVALWWWVLPAAGIPWPLGLLVALAMLGAGGLLLLRLAGWGRPTLRGSPTE
jgi:hypothetical protein